MYFLNGRFIIIASVLPCVKLIYTKYKILHIIQKFHMCVQGEYFCFFLAKNRAGRCMYESWYCAIEINFFLLYTLDRIIL
jgi:hypothetical protein